MFSQSGNIANAGKARRTFKWISLTAAFVLLIQLVLPLAGTTYAQGQNYQDIERHWAKADIQYLIDHKVVTGISENGALVIHPDSGLTRAEFITLLVRGFIPSSQLEQELEAIASSPFTDTAGHWASGYIAVAKDHGIAQGYNNGIFKPDHAITRAEIAAFILKIAAPHSAAGKGLSFSDVAPTHWAYKAISYAVEGKIALGFPDGSFKPSDSANRAQGMTMIARSMRYAEQLAQGDQSAAADPYTMKTSVAAVKKGDKVNLTIETTTTDLEFTVKWTADGGNLTVGEDGKSAVWSTNDDADKEYLISAAIQWQGKEIVKTATITGTKTPAIIEGGTYQPDNSSQGGGSQSNDSADDDKDGLANGMEATLGTNPSKPDTDGDGLTDGYEVHVLKTSPLKADTDSDGLTDSFEAATKALDPTMADTDADGTPDGAEDLDGDGLSNTDEQRHQTYPETADTDGDELADGIEVNKHRTNPLMKDTDEDDLDDGSEIKFGTDPLNPDSDKNGILDGHEKRKQELSSQELDVKLSFAATGDVDKTTTLTADEGVKDVVGTTGLIGEPVDILSTSKFDKAELSFSYADAALGSTNPADLRVLYYNPATLSLELVDDQKVDAANKQVTATLTHFSTYVLADMRIWAQSWTQGLVKGEAIPNIGGAERRPLDLVFVIDSSGSMGPGRDDTYNKDLDNNRIKGTKLVIDSLQAGDRAAVVDFDDYATLLQKLTDDKTKLKAAADRIDSYGGTNIGRGVKSALDELAASGRSADESTKVIILLTDGEGSYSSSYTSTAKSKGIIIYTMGLGNSFNAELLRQIADETGGDFYHVNGAEDLQGRFLQAGDGIGLTKDSDGDTIPDWVEAKGYIIKDTLGLKIEPTNPNDPDSDHDLIPDRVELGDWFYNAETGLVYVVRSTTIDGQPVNPNQGDPNKEDTDSDGDRDDIDDRDYIAYTEPVVFIHGIRSNTADVWGGDSYLDNGQPTGFLAMQDEGEFKKNILTEQTFSKRQSYQKNGIWYAYKSDAHFGNEQISYGDPDAQFVRQLHEGSEELPNIFPYLVNQGYKLNKNLFVFNWENFDHVLYASNFLREYLGTLSNTYLKDDLSVDVTRGADQEISFSLVGHSAGGLVSRTYIESPQAGDPKISKLITVDTPHWGSDDHHNPGVCGSVLADLDRDDSDLFYANPSNICPNYGADRLDFTNKGDTEYYFIGGLIGVKDRNMIFNDEFYYPKDTDPLLVQLSSATHAKTDDDLLEEIKSVLKNRLNIDLPEPKGSRTSDNYFGDNIVALGSQLGIPAAKQRNKDALIQSILYDGAYVFIGRDEAEHSTITHQRVIFELIDGLLSDANVEGLLD